MEKKRVHYLSLISVIACLAVIMLHSNNCFWTYSKDRWWLTANIIETVMYFAVPLFFMQAGATLIDYRDRYSTKEYFVKRITKTVIPFVVWSVFGVFWAASRGNFEITYDSQGLQNIFDAIINTSTVKIYWYFIPLFRIYLIIPLLGCIKEEYRKKIYVLLSIVLFAVDYYLCIAATQMQMPRNEIDKTGLYISYVLCGYLINKYEMSKQWRYLVYTLSLGGLAVHFFGTYLVSNEVGYIVLDWKGYGNIPCVLYSIGVFVLLKQIGQKNQNEKIISGIEFLSKYTFAVYLLHWYILKYMIDVFSIDVRSIIYRVGAPFVVFAICIIITYVVRKIPVLRKALP